MELEEEALTYIEENTIGRMVEMGPLGWEVAVGFWKHNC